MMADVSFETVARLLEVASIVGAAAFTMFRLGRAMEKFETIGRQQSSEITELKDGVKVIGDLVTKFALQTQRQDIFDAQLSRAEKSIDELRHGEGFVFPLSQATASRVHVSK